MREIEGWRWAILEEIWEYFILGPLTALIPWRRKIDQSVNIPAPCGGGSYVKYIRGKVHLGG